MLLRLLEKVKKQSDKADKEPPVKVDSDARRNDFWYLHIPPALFCASVKMPWWDKLGLRFGWVVFCF